MRNSNPRTTPQGIDINTDTTTWALPKVAIARLGRGMVRDVAFSPDKEMLAVGSRIGVWLYDISTSTPVALWDTERGVIFAVAFSPNGRLLATGNWDGTIKVWDIQNRQCISEMKREELFDAASQLAFSPDGHLLASSGGRYDAVYIWHSETGEEIAKFNDATARVWDVGSGKEIISLPLSPPLHTDSVSSTSPLNPDIYKGDADEIKAVLNAEKPRYRNTEIKVITFSPCGNLIAAGIEGGIRLWDARTYDTRMIILLPRICQRQFALAFSPCGRYLASGAWWWHTEKVAIRLWDVATGENIATFWGHPTDVQDLAFSPDGTLLASGSFDGTILLWDMKPYIPPIDPH